MNSRKKWDSRGMKSSGNKRFVISKRATNSRPYEYEPDRCEICLYVSGNFL